MTFVNDPRLSCGLDLIANKKWLFFHQLEVDSSNLMNEINRITKT